MKVVFTYNKKTQKADAFVYHGPGPLPPIIDPPEPERLQDTAPPDPPKPDPKPS